MLVLSRKTDQQIHIGDDITITVVRVEGNRVRIGIDAPRELRIVRGELEPVKETIEFELSERELAFAHEQEPKRASNANSADAEDSDAQVYTGKVSADGSKVQLKAELANPVRRSPLAGFVSAS
ncbi:carbon storage regulator [Stieleria sp. JC731]|uniref:carbon storage regulator n=1 Tax=Pirellulaceae TaxID=2691357 RepID=UPI001E53627B|nr:carbon storage regulator [Stieleria sp. JC731]MCC9600025.1 carbon storage regulator [Stieleria sp. JC731]